MMMLATLFKMLFLVFGCSRNLVSSFLFPSPSASTSADERNRRLNNHEEYYHDGELVFNHIPKTGGTSVEMFSKNKNFSSCKIHIFHKDGVLNDLCNTTSGKKSTTPLHCYQSTNKKFNEFVKIHPFQSFCIVRNPVDRFMSSYNMRIGDADYFENNGIDRSQKCDEEVIDRYIQKHLTVGDYDNHDLPQASYYCNLKLCFENMTQQLFAIYRERGCDENIVNQTKLPTLRQHNPNSCKVSDISCKGIKALEKQYSTDIDIHKRACKSFYSNWRQEQHENTNFISEVAAAKALKQCK